MKISRLDLLLGCFAWTLAGMLWAQKSVAAEVSGILFGEKEITIKSKSQGEVTALHFTEGDRVSGGAVIAVIDDRQEIIELELAKLEHQSAELDYEKTKKIKKYISLDEVRQKRDLAAMKKANMDLKEYSLSNTRVVSPIEGIITKKYFDLGETVSVGDKVFEVVQLDNLIIEMNPPSESALALQKGDKLTFKIDTNREKKFEGEISYISPVIDAASGTVKVRLTVKNNVLPDKTYRLQPGMLATVELSKEQLQQDQSQGIPKK